MTTPRNQRFRPPRKFSLIHGALLASFFLHLSLVTLFRVVIYFPREDIEYMDFRIVAAPVSAPEAVQTEQFPEMGQGLTLGNARRAANLPEVELPTMEFAELRRLRVGRERSDTLARRIDLLDSEPADSWARFARSLQNVGETLGGLRLGHGAEAPVTPVEVPATTVRPAPGFEGSIEWERDEADRPLLFAPPMSVLSEHRVSELPLPIKVVFQVNDIGRVVDVFSPTVDTLGVVETVQMAVLRYRFEPLAPGTERSRPDTATLILDSSGGSLRD